MDTLGAGCYKESAHDQNQTQARTDQAGPAFRIVGVFRGRPHESLCRSTPTPASGQEPVRTTKPPLPQSSQYQKTIPSRLLTNNPKKLVGLVGYGFEIVEQVPIRVKPNPRNARYLKTKRQKMGHLL